MAKAQLENGYTKIANELLEKACSTQLNTNEFRVFFAIVRLSENDCRQKLLAALGEKRAAKRLIRYSLYRKCAG